MSFQDFKKKQKDSVTFLTSQIDDMDNKSKAPNNKFKDDRFWNVTRDDKTGNGFAIIRLLPAADGENLPFAKFHSHYFKGPNDKIFNELCPTTIAGQKCPVCMANTKLWNSGNEHDKKIVRNRSRKTTYVSNVLVISDPKNPEAQGKVFLFRYGKKIWEKINLSMYPSDDERSIGTQPINPFDFWTGRNLRIKVKLVKTGEEEYPNYDDSVLDSSTPLMNGDDKELEKIWKQQHSLREFTDPTRFKSFEELQARFREVWDDENGPDEAPFAPTKNISAPSRAPSKPSKPSFENTDDGESSLDYFKKLNASE